MIAPIANQFLIHPQTSNVIRLLAVNFLLSTIGFLSMTVLTREMNYRALVIPGIVGAIVRCCVGAILSACGAVRSATMRCAQPGVARAASCTN